MSTASAVSCRSVTKSYGDVVALDGIDLEIARGEIHGLVGPNGAGKTTLLGLLLGLATADAGEIVVLGERVGAVHGVPRGVAGFVDSPGLYPWLTARKNLEAVAGLSGLGGTDVRRLVDDALDQVGLTDVADDRLRGFSLGMRQRLGLAAALMTSPELVVLDEPANGLDPAGRRHVHQVLRNLTDRGTAVVLSSHQMDDIATLCPRVTILANGRVSYNGATAELAATMPVLDYRVVTNDPVAAHAAALEVPGLTVLAERDPARPTDAALLVRGPVATLDQLVARLVGAGVAVRELGPVVAPLEAAFLALTGSAHDPHRADHPGGPATRPARTARTARSARAAAKDVR